MPEYIRSFIKRLQETNGKDFLEQLYQAMKEEHKIYEAVLPPNPLLTTQLRPEHDIRSRMPEYYAKHVVQPKIKDTGFYGRQIKYGPGDEHTR